MFQSIFHRFEEFELLLLFFVILLADGSRSVHVLMALVDYPAAEAPAGCSMTIRRLETAQFHLDLNISTDLTCQEQRSDILDALFLPNSGAAVHILKVRAVHFCILFDVHFDRLWIEPRWKSEGTRSLRKQQRFNTCALRKRQRSVGF